MKIGYPCANLSVGQSASRTFRLASYSPERLIETVQSNLDAVQMILDWNYRHEILYFRISSDTVPFASHPVMTVNWQRHFAAQLAQIGAFVRKHHMRINTHPGQYTLLNSPRPEVAANSVAELVYHAELLDLMELDHTHKIQIHTGGVYGDKSAASQRFVERYQALPASVRNRLVIENDERNYSLGDNLLIHESCGVPLLFDTFHHSILNQGETLAQALDLAAPTWRGHGVPMIDYSTQHPEKQAGAHAHSIDLADFASFMDQLGDRDVDVMLEIKDKEVSALKAQEWLRTQSVATRV
jgi:UV DNA damage endonuclease